MKFLVFCLLVIANFSHNGKASLDSFSPASANVLLEDSARNSDSCSRPCKFNVKPRRCEYKFRIAPTFSDEDQPVISINDMIPGPPINVCVNDIIVVEVENKIPDQDLSLHWHGIDQRGTPYMDGVPMVTQCPIPYNSKYKYAFRASSPGTFFYHADSVSHQSDGVFGALIVNQPQPLEPHSAMYDYDRSGENVLLTSAVFPELFTGNLKDLNEVKPVALHLNGDQSSSKVFVMEGFAYRLRLVNAIAIDCPILYEIEQHDMTVIAADGIAVKPVPAKHILLYPGERMDVVVRASQSPGGYWVSARGYGGACAGLAARSMLIYSGFNYTSMLVEETKPLITDELDLNAIIHGLALESLTEMNMRPKVETFYLGIDKNTQTQKYDNDYRYVSDAITKKPFFPVTYELKETSLVQINGKNFLYPNSPILLKPKDVRPEMICYVGEEKRHQEPQCIQMLKAPEDKLIELALVNEGFGSNDSYVFHIHGSSMQVVASWQSRERKPVSKDEFLRWDRDGKISRNTVNPPLKDTVVVPNKGYAIVRIRPDNPGAWLLECRACYLSSLPTAILITVPQTLPKVVLDSLPSMCGNYRPPDVLLH